MTHFLHDLFQADPAEPVIIQHQQEGVLYQGQAGMGFFIRTFLLSQGMGRMVGGDYIQSVIQQGFP